MLSLVLTILAVFYIALNLVLFGSSLMIGSLHESLKYLFFGAIIISKEMIFNPFIKNK